MRTIIESLRGDQSVETGSNLNAAAHLVSLLVAFWQKPWLQRKSVQAGLVIVAVLACLARGYIGLRGSDIFTHDAFMLLDGAWRMLNGQRPHIDFYSHLGLLTYVPTLVGLWMSHGTSQALGYGQAITGVLVGVWAYALGRKRLSDAALILVTLVAVLMATAPFSLGFSPLSISPGMTYNRLGYVFIALVMIEGLAEHRPATRGPEFLGGVSTGAIIAILFFLKITYFMAAVFLVAALIRCRRQTRQRWTGLLIGLAASCLPFLFYFGFQIKPMLSDLTGVAGGKHVRLRWYFLDGILQDAGFLLAFVIVAAILLTTYKEAKAARAVLIAAFAVCAAGVLLIFGNYEQSGFPLAVFLAIVVIDAVNLPLTQLQIKPSLFHASVVLLGSAFVLGSLTSNALGFSYGLVERVWQARNALSIDSPRLNGFAPVKEEEYYRRLYNDGLDLVRKYRQPGDTIMSLDFCNPFSYGLGMKPAPGGATVLQYKTTFNDRYRPSAERLFGSAELVIVPKAFDPDLNDVLRLYGPYLNNHFRMIGESTYWTLYRNAHGSY